MKIFVDYHHSDLYYSLHLLFEKRLGFELYKPIGMDWYTDGYWKIAEPYNNNIDVIKQFLTNDIDYPERYHPIWGNYKINCKDGVYYIYEPHHDYHQKAITLETFKNTKFDIILSTYQLHDYVFEKLKNDYQPDAKLVAHLGNTFQETHYKNVIHSVPYNRSIHQNSVYIHQELDTNLYKFVPPNKFTKNIFSVVNCAPYIETYEKFKHLLDDCNFKYYGAACPDGCLSGAKGVSEKICEANLGWCLKPLGGLGHSNMGWMYSGRAVITNMSQHKIWGGNALKFFEPDYNCIDIDSGSDVEICEKIKKWLDPEINIKMGENAKRRFHEIINYNAEEQMFRLFLSKLL